MKAAVVHSFTEPLTVDEVATPEPGPAQAAIGTAVTPIAKAQHVPGGVPLSPSAVCRRASQSSASGSPSSLRPLDPGAVRV
jgi:hypothetical protein